MKHTLKQALTTEITRSKNNPYGKDELELLNEFHLQQLLQDIILEGDRYEHQNLNEWTHVRNK